MRTTENANPLIYHHFCYFLCLVSPCTLWLTKWSSCWLMGIWLTKFLFIHFSCCNGHPIPLCVWKNKGLGSRTKYEKNIVLLQFSWWCGKKAPVWPQNTGLASLLSVLAHVISNSPSCSWRWMVAEENEEHAAINGAIKKFLPYHHAKRLLPASFFVYI